MDATDRVFRFSPDPIMPTDGTTGTPPPTPEGDKPPAPPTPPGATPQAGAPPAQPAGTQEGDGVTTPTSPREYSAFMARLKPEERKLVTGMFKNQLKDRTDSLTKEKTERITALERELAELRTSAAAQPKPAEAGKKPNIQLPEAFKDLDEETQGQYLALLEATRTASASEKAELQKMIDGLTDRLSALEAPGKDKADREAIEGLVTSARSVAPRAQRTVLAALAALQQDLPQNERSDFAELGLQAQAEFYTDVEEALKDGDEGTLELFLKWLAEEALPNGSPIATRLQQTMLEALKRHKDGLPAGAPQPGAEPAKGKGLNDVYMELMEG